MMMMQFGEMGKQPDAVKATLSASPEMTDAVQDDADERKEGREIYLGMGGSTMMWKRWRRTNMYAVSM